MRAPAWKWTMFLVALSLKWIGATWDVAWHFRQTNDVGSPAHTINIVGNVLLAVTLIWAWRTKSPVERRPLLAVGTGLVMAAVAIPLDIGWHRLFGLDLTTWSPTHLFLFTGTAVMASGLVWLSLAQAGWHPGVRLRALSLTRGRWVLIAFLLARTLSIALFPAVFNEYAAVAAINHDQGYALYGVEDDVKQFIETRDDLAYDNLPHLLYPAFTFTLIIVASAVIRRLTGVPYLATLLTAFYVATRVISDSVLGATGWPMAALPYQHILVAAVTDGFAALPGPALVRAGLAGLAAGLLAYIYWAVASPWTYTVPMDWSAAPWAVVIAATASVVVHWVPGRFASSPHEVHSGDGLQNKV